MTPPDAAELASLIERCKAATGPDRELDVDLAWALEPTRYASAYWNGRTGKPGTTLPKKLDGMGRASVRHNCPSLTDSIDAALALVDRVLPGRAIAMGISTNPSPYAAIAPSTLVNAATVPLAIILALLLALESSRSDKNG